jgi:predicted aspartyl protease
MWEYNDSSFTPPAPIAQVTIHNREASLQLNDVPMLIDTGADITLIPDRVVSALALSLHPSKQYEIQAYDGHTSSVPVVQTELVFCGRTFRGQFLVVDQEWGILGRNVLNAIPILLNGPKRYWNVYQELSSKM